MGANDNRKQRFKYEMIISDILRRIHSGEWRKGEQIPTLDELTGMYNVSRMTTVRAIQELSKQGILKGIRGSGTIVAQHRPSMSVGLIISESVLYPQHGPWASMFARELRNRLERIDCHCRLYIEPIGQNTPNSNIMPEILADIQNNAISGLVLAHSNASQYLYDSDEFRQLDFPVVAVSSNPEIAHRVTADMRTVISCCLEYCQKQNCHTLAVFNTPDKSMLQNMAEKAGIEVRDEWLFDWDDKGEPERKGYEVMMRFASQKPRPEVLFVSDDIVTKGVFHALDRLGVNIPEDLHLVSTGNKGSGVFFPTPIPMIEFDISEYAQKCVDMILRLIRVPELSPETGIVKPELMLPETSSSPNPASAAALESGNL